MIHFFLTQHKFQKLVKKVQTTELLQNFELLDLSMYRLIFRIVVKDELIEITWFILRLKSLRCQVQNLSKCKVSIFADIRNRREVVQQIQSILNDSWLDIKRQINVFIASVWGILGWYYTSCLAINLYNTFFSTGDFEVLYRMFDLNK